MQETFKNVSIFLVFLVSLLFWNMARDWMLPYFDFRYGTSLLLCLWSTAVVIIFHLLYYFLRKTRDATIYLTTVITLVAVGFLSYFGKLPLS